MFKIILMKILLFTMCYDFVSAELKYRIAVPNFVCTKNSTTDASRKNSDETPIRLLGVYDESLKYEWAVSFKTDGRQHRNQQRFNLQVWKCVRDLEKMLQVNSDEIARKGVVMLNNSMMMPGVEYIFNLTIVNDDVREANQFVINYVDPKTTPKTPKIADSNSIDISDKPKISVLLLSPDKIYADMEYIIYADIAICSNFSDYRIAWNVVGPGNHNLELSLPSSSYLSIPTGTLMAGAGYQIHCSILDRSNLKVLTKEIAHVKIIERMPKIQLCSTNMVLSADTPFVVNADFRDVNQNLRTLSFTWTCSKEERDSCSNFETMNTTTLNISSGFTNVGNYNLQLEASVNSIKISNKMFVKVIPEQTPVINIIPSTLWQDVDPAKSFTIKAFLANIEPGCVLQWTSLEESNCSFINLNDLPGNVGNALPINSLEDNFLQELVDYTDESSNLDFNLNIPPPNGDTWKGFDGDTCYKFRLTIKCKPLEDGSISDVPPEYTTDKSLEVDTMTSEVMARSTRDLSNEELTTFSEVSNPDLFTMTTVSVNDTSLTDLVNENQSILPTTSMYEDTSAMPGSTFEISETRVSETSTEVQRTSEVSETMTSAMMDRRNTMDNTDGQSTLSTINENSSSPRMSESTLEEVSTSPTIDSTAYARSTSFTENEKEATPQIGWASTDVSATKTSDSLSSKTDVEQSTAPTLNEIQGSTTVAETTDTSETMTSESSDKNSVDDRTNTPNSKENELTSTITQSSNNNSVDDRSTSASSNVNETTLTIAQTTTEVCAMMASEYLGSNTADDQSTASTIYESQDSATVVQTEISVTSETTDSNSAEDQNNSPTSNENKATPTTAQTIVDVITTMTSESLSSTVTVDKSIAPTVNENQSGTAVAETTEITETMTSLSSESSDSNSVDDQNYSPTSNENETLPTIAQTTINVITTMTSESSDSNTADDQNTAVTANENQDLSTVAETIEITETMTSLSSESSDSNSVDDQNNSPASNENEATPTIAQTTINVITTMTSESLSSSTAADKSIAPTVDENQGSTTEAETTDISETMTSESSDNNNADDQSTAVAVTREITETMTSLSSESSDSNSVDDRNNSPTSNKNEATPTIAQTTINVITTTTSESLSRSTTVDKSIAPTVNENQGGTTVAETTEITETMTSESLESSDSNVVDDQSNLPTSNEVSVTIPSKTSDVINSGVTFSETGHPTLMTNQEYSVTTVQVTDETGSVQFSRTSFPSSEINTPANIGEKTTEYAPATSESNTGYKNIQDESFLTMSTRDIGQNTVTTFDEPLNTLTSTSLLTTDLPMLSTEFAGTSSMDITTPTSFKSSTNSEESSNAEPSTLFFSPETSSTTSNTGTLQVSTETLSQNVGDNFSTTSHPIIFPETNENEGITSNDLHENTISYGSNEITIRKRRQTEDISKETEIYADIVIYTNAPPKVNELTITPSIGEALNTVFQLESVPATDQSEDSPLLYKFGCILGNETIMIKRIYEISSTDTILPYSQNPIQCFLEVCDSRGSCAMVTGNEIRTKLAENITEPDNNDLVKFIIQQLTQYNFPSAFMLAKTVLITFKAKTNDLFQQTVNILKETISQILADFSNSPATSMRGDINSFLEEITQILTDLELSESDLQTLVKLRDQSLDSNSRRERRSTQSKTDPITSQIVQNFIEISSLLILKSSNPQEDKKLFVEKIPKYLAGLCKTIQFDEIHLDTQIIQIGFEKFNIQQRSNDILQISYTNLQTENVKIKLGKLFKDIFVEHYGDEELPCIGKIVYNNDYFSRNVSEIQHVYNVELYNTRSLTNLQLEPLNNYGVHIKIPLKDNINNSYECVTWTENSWDSSFCSTVDLTVNFIHCQCKKLGHFTILKTNISINTLPSVPNEETISTFDLGKNSSNPQTNPNMNTPDTMNESPNKTNQVTTSINSEDSRNTVGILSENSTTTNININDTQNLITSDTQIGNDTQISTPVNTTISSNSTDISGENISQSTITNSSNNSPQNFVTVGPNQIENDKKTSTSINSETSGNPNDISGENISQNTITNSSNNKTQSVVTIGPDQIENDKKTSTPIYSETYGNPNDISGENISQNTITNSSNNNTRSVVTIGPDQIENNKKTSTSINSETYGNPNDISGENISQNTITNSSNNNTRSVVTMGPYQIENDKKTSTPINFETSGSPTDISGENISQNIITNSSNNKTQNFITVGPNQIENDKKTSDPIRSEITTIPMEITDDTSSKNIVINSNKNSTENFRTNEPNQINRDSNIPTSINSESYLAENNTRDNSKTNAQNKEHNNITNMIGTTPIKVNQEISTNRPTYTTQIDQTNSTSVTPTLVTISLRPVITDPSTIQNLQKPDTKPNLLNNDQVDIASLNISTISNKTTVTNTSFEIHQITTLNATDQNTIPNSVVQNNADRLNEENSETIIQVSSNFNQTRNEIDKKIFDTTQIPLITTILDLNLIKNSTITTLLPNDKSNNFGNQKAYNISTDVSNNLNQTNTFITGETSVSSLENSYFNQSNNTAINQNQSTNSQSNVNGSYQSISGGVLNNINGSNVISSGFDQSNNITTNQNNSNTFPNTGQGNADRSDLSLLDRVSKNNDSNSSISEVITVNNTTSSEGTVTSLNTTNENYQTAQFGILTTSEDITILVLLCGIIGMSFVTLILWKRIRNENIERVVHPEEIELEPQTSSAAPVKYASLYAEDMLSGSRQIFLNRSSTELFI